MGNRKCPVCGATWLANQLYWSGTQKKGDEKDLNALVCRQLEEEKQKDCINPCKGQPGGMGWEERLEMLDAALSEFDL
jgi:hypothetical protein